MSEQESQTARDWPNEDDVVEQRNIGSSVCANKLLEIATTGEHRGTFGGKAEEAAAQAILALRSTVEKLERDIRERDEEWEIALGGAGGPHVTADILNSRMGHIVAKVVHDVRERAMSGLQSRITSLEGDIRRLTEENEELRQRLLKCTHFRE